ncbi:MAG: hypothetical protein K5841_08745 [Fretibacterium sp.]|nr:hypothetical protein [Fretibacterium sp.]
MKRNIFLTSLLMLLLAVPAKADFTALERGLTSGRIIYSVSENSYLTKSGEALTEAAIANLTSPDYTKTGLVADGNTRLILRYKSSQPGSVEFNVSPDISGSRLELFADRQEISAPVSAVKTNEGYQVSAVFIAPETWPASIEYPKGNFTVTAEFTPSNGGAPTTESLTLTLQAPPVVLIHGEFSNNEDTFGYGNGTKSGVWHKLEAAGLTVTGWNYDNKKGPTELIANNSNGLAKTIAGVLDSLNEKGIAATRADLVTHSMGGLMARQYLRNDIDTGNRTPNSYGLGTVRRVVTIAAPHRGTPLASYLSGKFDTMPSSWQTWEAKSWWEESGYLLIKMLALRDYDVEGMLADLALDSSFVGLGYPGVPFHSIYGKVKSDNDKINKLFDDVVSENKVELKKIDWLPQQTVDMLTSEKLRLISTVLKAGSDTMKFKELFGALFGDDDHDLVVSEPSAKDIFPSNAVTSFTGLGTHNHIMIARQDDTGDRVAALLKGDAGNFMINTASTSAYDAAFNIAAKSYGEYLRASNEDMSKYVDGSLKIQTSELKEDGSSQSVIISGDLEGDNDESGEYGDLFLVVETMSGASKFFSLNDDEDDGAFDLELWSDKDDKDNKGIFDVRVMVVQEGEVKMTEPVKVVFPPMIDENSVTGISFSNGGRLYGNAGDEIHIGLIVHTEDGDYDISAPDFDLASYDLSSASASGLAVTSASDIAEVTGSGNIKFLKEGTVKLEAKAYGQTVAADVIVKPSEAAPEEDTTRDIEDGGIKSDRGSSSGCNAGIGLAALAFLAFIRKMR